MSDEVDFYTDTIESRKRGKKLYCRCNKCSQFFQVDEGVPCPNPKCGGVMI